LRKACKYKCEREIFNKSMKNNKKWGFYNEILPIQVLIYYAAQTKN